MSAELWTPADGIAPELTSDVALPDGTAVRHRVCDFCGARFGWHQEGAFLRHFEKCWKQVGEDATGEKVEMRRNEPLHAIDHERDRHRRQKAEERKDPTVKGTSAWDPERVERKARRSSTLDWKRRKR